jgi:putative transcriptional regulator
LLVDEGKVAPGLLLSMPHLVDPNFTRAVVLMVEHSDEGSFGLIINQPSTMSVATLLEQLEIEWRGDPDEVVWSGGPVMPTTGWVLHQPMPAPRPPDDPSIASMVDIAPGIVLSTSPEILKDIADSPPAKVRFLLGYSGWGPGQLAAEMVRGSWLHANVSSDLVFETPPDEMWETALRSIGVDPEAIVPGQGVH